MRENLMSLMCRRLLVIRYIATVAFALGITAGTIARAQDDAPKRRPNLLVILVDDLGYGDLSCYGATDLRSPELDQLIGSGLRFNNFYANCPVCSPTRASLLTGCYPELVGVPGVIRTHAENSWGYLHPDATLLPEQLARVGYDTACIGKWHLGLDNASHPLTRGFQRFHGFLGDMMDDYYLHRRHDVNYMREQRRTIKPKGHATDLFTNWACDYLRSRQEKTEPFFLYLAYNAPHTPIQPPQNWLDKVRKRQPSVSAKRAKLVALIEHLDHGIGQVIRCLKECQLDQHTLIVFTSDNGGQLNVGASNGPLRDGKQSMYEGGLKVPAAVVWPGVIREGTQTDSIGVTMDLYPTLCEIAGVDTQRLTQSIQPDGLSLRPTLMGESQDTSNRSLFFHRREGGVRYGGLTVQAVRRGPWKLLQNSPFAAQELYNLDTDPGEQRDVRAEHARVFRELAAELRRQTQRGGAVPWQSAAPPGAAEGHVQR